MNLPTLNKGQVFSFSLKWRKNVITGLVINTSQEWTLLKYIPVDYVIDGDILIRNKTLKKYWRDESEKFKEDVLKAKGVKLSSSLNLSIKSLDGPLKKIYKEGSLVQFESIEDDVCYVGKIIKIFSDSFCIRSMSTKGVWLNEMEYKTESIWTIQVDNDYLQSLMAYNERKK